MIFQNSIMKFNPGRRRVQKLIHISAYKVHNNCGKLVADVCILQGRNSSLKQARPSSVAIRLREQIFQSKLEFLEESLFTVLIQKGKLQFAINILLYS